MKKFLLLSLCLMGFLNAQNTLSGRFSPAEDYSFAFLYKATTDGADYIDRAKLNAEGGFSITLDSSLASGIYKVVYAIPPEQNNFDFIYNGKESVAFNFTTDSGIEFTGSNENKLWASYIKSMGMINQTISNYYQTDGTDQAAFKDIFKTMRETQNAYETSAEGLLVLQLIKANKPYMPESYEDLSTYTSNLQRTYFNHIDFDNTFLQTTSFITDRLNNYIFNGSTGASDTEYINRVEDVSKAIASSKAATQLRIYKLLWEGFVQLNKPKVSTYIAEQYLINLATSENDTALLKDIKAQQRIAIGAKAPNFKLDYKGNATSLHELSANTQYLLIFWSSGCSHCLKEVPEVHKLAKDNPKITVVAYALEEDVAQWQATIADMPEFIHVYGPKKWDNPIVAQYSLTATPTYFLLDSNKTIIAKPYALKDVSPLIKVP